MTLPLGLVLLFVTSAFCALWIAYVFGHSHGRQSQYRADAEALDACRNRHPSST